MRKRELGRTGLDVSALCLGTMTWGEQNTEADAFEQLDCAMEQGINFIDAAEMYPVPPRAETQGETERYLGNWLARRGRRDDLVIASKVTGPGNGLKYLRGGPRLNRQHIREAAEASLTRLQTDYLDLYQVHWPERPANYFGKLGYQPIERSDITPIEDTLAALAELVEEGKVRHIGISNETPWGTMEYLRLSEKHGWPRIASIQNPYNLLNRSFEAGLAEIAHREQVGLLAYSPLAFGMLSGKYVGGRKPEGARLTRFERFARYTTEQGYAATEAYAELAQEAGLSLAQMALSYINSRPFLTSNIIGATTLGQLRENIGTMDLTLPDDLLERIEAVHRQYTYPCP
ncbi:aryl-alcohol dehydrogenase-like predicted oxidoreductase [Tamilnaduibacter salinus]|uniref:Protein tas n=1 Tax=Tamilnaduibacter salinus TaxID=1484056 RepID=A0A2A2I6L3_9GAMM|nr:NADP(H)-dependent aldo-keto reductase [Tamilnaduibacter salinus]PAV27297.1 NADP(H)-dependent aldo-keto reductase [Tamilnaduibacter salinus]PVY78942.1 aryl-alcohol dehydrogenase-like predicted oxidoreductase [Tamilnaduibacter salinus]